MTDISDQATKTEEELRNFSLRVQQQKSGLDGKTVVDSALQCVVCTDPIPQDRREAVPGVSTCIDCQGDLERAMRTNTRGYP